MNYVRKVEEARSVWSAGSIEKQLSRFVGICTHRTMFLGTNMFKLFSFAPKCDLLLSIARPIPIFAVRACLQCLHDW